MYIDLLTKIKNAQLAKKEAIKIIYSKNKERIAEILAQNNFIESVEKKGRMPKRFLSIKIKYENGEGAIKGVKFLSKPSRHLYGGYKKIKSVRSGYGIMVISTSGGIMTGREARRKKLGGEALFEIW